MVLTEITWRGRAKDSRSKLQVEGWWEHGYEPTLPKNENSFLTS